MTLYLAIIESMGKRFTLRVRANSDTEATNKALWQCDVSARCLQVLPVGSYPTVDVFA